MPNTGVRLSVHHRFPVRAWTVEWNFKEIWLNAQMKCLGLNIPFDGFDQIQKIFDGGFCKKKMTKWFLETWAYSEIQLRFQKLQFIETWLYGQYNLLAFSLSIPIRIVGGWVLLLFHIWFLVHITRILCVHIYTVERN